GVLKNGIPAAEYHSGLAIGHERSQIVLFGSQTTCKLDLLAQQLRLCGPSADASDGELVARVGDEWRVERDFIDAVLAARHGERWQVSPDFAQASRYMRKLQAIHDAAARSRVVQLADDFASS